MDNMTRKSIDNLDPYTYAEFLRLRRMICQHEGYVSNDSTVRYMIDITLGNEVNDGAQK